MKGISERTLMNVSFQMKKNDDGSEVHQIYIYDDVKEFGRFNYQTWKNEESTTSAKYFKQKLDEIPDGEPIELFINSNGGSVKEGTAIFNQLKRKNSEITGYVDGVAHSIAFVILQACDKRIMGEGTSALIHEMLVSCMGNADDLEMVAEQLRQWMKSSRKLFMNRAKGITEEELEELMKKETMLTPEQALEYGFIDEIAGKANTDDSDISDTITQMKKEFQTKQDFGTDMEEFENLINAEQKQSEPEGNPMAAFFSAFL